MLSGYSSAMIVFLLNSNVVTDHVDNLKNVFIFDFSHSIPFGQQQQPKKKKLLHVPHGRHWAMKRGAIIRPTISCRRGGGFVCEKQDNLRQVINHQRTFELETTHTAVVHAGSVVQCTYLDETNHLRGETNTRNITEEKKRPQGRSQSSLPRAYV